MNNSSIFLQSNSTVKLKLDCIEETVTDQYGNVFMSRLWIDPEDDILLDFHLYSVFDHAEVDQTILINDQLFTVTKIVKFPATHSAHTSKDKEEVRLALNTSETAHQSD